VPQLSRCGTALTSTPALHAARAVWSSSGDSATVNQSTTTTTGSVVLPIYDKNGTQVYFRVQKAP
jgi:hypothetical protein